MAETPHEEEILGRAFEPRLAKRLFSLVRPYRRYVVGSVVALLLESVAQLAGPLLMAAAIDLLFTKGGTGAGPASRGVDGFFRIFGIDLGAGHGIEWIAALSILMAVLAFVFMVVMVAWTSQMGQGVMYDLRTRIFSHLRSADIAVFDRTPVGRLMTRLTTDVDALNELFTSGFVALLGDVAVLAGIVAILFALDTTLAAI
ncbi:MAG: ABC transporter transmembrane domain-containing protein, partial [Thermoanaerobaculia bacterium]